MIETKLPLPASADEYLRTVKGTHAVMHVMMKDGRLLRVSYDLMPRYDEKGKPIPERRRR